MAVFGLSLCGASHSGDRPLWKDIPKAAAAKKNVKIDFLKHYRVLELDIAALQQLLARQAAETGGIREARSVIALPLPDGSFARFRFTASATTAPGPGNKDSGSRTYLGQGIDNVYHGVAFDLSPSGFHAMITQENQVVFIEPVQLPDAIYYICYYKHDIKPGKRIPFEESGPIKH